MRRTERRRDLPERDTGLGLRSRYRCRERTASLGSDGAARSRYRAVGPVWQFIIPGRTNWRGCSAQKSKTAGQAEQIGGDVRPGSQKPPSRPNKQAGMFGPEVRNRRAGRTNWRKCSARKSETAEQAEQPGGDVRPGSQKPPGRPNKLAGMFGSEIRNRRRGRTNWRGCSARKSETAEQAEQIGGDVRPGSQKPPGRPNKQAGMFGPEVRNRRAGRMIRQICSAQNSKRHIQAEIP